MKQKLLVILGTTSTGKTDLALELAKKLNGELISADSRQVYKYLDIGTGKLPGKYEQLKKEEGFWQIDGINIQLYDVADPQTRFNLYEYILKASEVIKGITANGKLPILVGGTGLYIRGLLEGISDFGNEENPQLRNELEELNIQQIKQRIEEITPGVLKKLNNSEINNKRRLIRILEKLSSPGDAKKSFPGISKDFDVLKIGLKADRQIISDRINKRVLKRTEEGMVEESRKLLADKKITYQRMDELGLEYRYLAKLLKGEIKSLNEFIEILSLRISQFAKRQETWFKREKEVVWFDLSDKDFTQKVAKTVVDWYNEA